MAEAVSAKSGPEIVRLHITPFSPALLKAIIPPSILPVAQNISYHSLQTFPEKVYGFVDLPIMDAQKIKSKLHGSILKGTKIQIDDARPAPKQDTSEAEDSPKPRRVKSEKPKKRKRNDETLPGAEVRDRKIKRGWTEPTASTKRERKSKDKSDKKEIVKSKYTTGPECLFRTTIPANLAPVAKGTPVVADMNPERRKRISAGKDTVIHEFAKSTKYATFLRSSMGPATSSGAAEFVEGKGWVDQDGKVLEAVVMKAKPAVVKPEVASSVGSDEESSVLEEDSSDEDILTEKGDITDINLSHFTKNRVYDSSTSSSGISESEDSISDISSSESDSDSDSEQLEVEGEDAVLKSQETRQPISSPERPMSLSGSPIGLSIKIPQSISAPDAVEVHPLEALYKRRQSENTPKPIIPSFSFFGEDGDDEDAEDQAVPMTPFTKQDFAYRGIRSAAPTPDTAHPSKPHLSWPSNGPEDGDDENFADQSDTPTQKQRSTTATETDPSAAVTDFQKWFYEHRGESNRAWKKRRKTAAKEKRQRENRKSGEVN